MTLRERITAAIRSTVERDRDEPGILELSDDVTRAVAGAATGQAYRTIVVGPDRPLSAEPVVIVDPLAEETLRSDRALLARAVELELRAWSEAQVAGAMRRQRDDAEVAGIASAILRDRGTRA